MTMFKNLLAFVAALCATAAMAAVDVNQATEAQLDAVNGIGPATSKLILKERKKGEFKDWPDFIARVKGVGDNKAAKLSAGGLTVNGAAYAGTKPAAADKAVTEKVADGAKVAGAKTKEVAVQAVDKTKEAAKDAKAAVTADSKK